MTPTRIGFVVSSLGASQLGYHLLAECDAYLKTHIDIDVIVFYQNVVRTWKIPPFAMMNITECYGFDGVAVATSVETAEKLAGMPGPSLRLFYAWDLEWICDRGHPYERLVSVYNNPSLPVIARCRRHAEIIEHDWNRPVAGVVEECNLTQFREVIDRYASSQRRLLPAGVHQEGEEHPRDRRGTRHLPQ